MQTDKTTTESKQFVKCPKCGAEQDSRYTVCHYPNCGEVLNKTESKQPLYQAIKMDFDLVRKEDKPFHSYARLATDNLHHLAATLESIISICKDPEIANIRQKVISIELNMVLDDVELKAKEALNRIS